MKKPLLAILALTIVTSPAFAQRDCLRTADIRDWRAIDNNRTLLVEDSWRNQFRLSLIGNCSNLRFRNSVAFRSRGGSRLSCLVPGDTIITRDRMMGNSRCAITRIERISTGTERRSRRSAAADNPNPAGNQ
jgi:hypothetical protein